MEMYLSDGNIFVTLADGLTDAIAVLENYVPKHGQGKETVAETCRIIIEGKDLTKETARKLGRLFVQAERYQQKKMGNQVYVYFRSDDWEEWYRSEILRGRFELDERALDELWAGGLIEGAVIWERRPYWEGEEQELQLSNPTTTDLPELGGITLYNPTDNIAVLGDPDLSNYMDIRGDDVAGDLPAPIRLELTNTYNNVAQDGTFWIGQNRLSDPFVWQHIFEAEDSTTGGTPVNPDSTCSQSTRVDFTLGSDSETVMLTWTLSAEQLSAAGGNWFRALIHFSEFANFLNIADAKYRLKLVKDGVVLWTGEQVRPAVGLSIQDLGSIQLPPWSLSGGDSSVTIDLVLTGQRLTGGSEVLGLDFLQLVPLDAWIELRRLGGGVAYNKRLVVDGLSEIIYSDSGADTPRQANWVALGGAWPMVWPGEDSRIFVLVHSWTTYVAAVLRTHEARAYYRPRRSTL